MPNLHYLNVLACNKWLLDDLVLNWINYFIKLQKVKRIDKYKNNYFKNVLMDGSFKLLLNHNF